MPTPTPPTSTHKRPHPHPSPPPPASQKRTRHHRTLYSTTAGHSTTRRATTNPLHPRVGAPLTPYESLSLTSHRAPPRYEEPAFDVWDFQRWLPQQTTRRADLDDRGGETPTSRMDKLRGLPGDDVLKGLVRYVAYYYAGIDPQQQGCELSGGRGGDDDGQMSLYSLDETALLGMGILLEETARAVVAPDGKGGEGWRALVRGLRSEREEDALDVVDENGGGVVTGGGGRMKADARIRRGKGKNGRILQDEDEETEEDDAHESLDEEEEVQYDDDDGHGQVDGDGEENAGEVLTSDNSNDDDDDDDDDDDEEEETGSGVNLFVQRGSDDSGNPPDESALSKRRKEKIN